MRGAVRFDPTRPEVQHRIADVLRSLGHEVGHLLPVALGGRVGDAVEVGPSCGADAPGGPCDYEPGHAQPHKAGNTRMLRPVPAARVSARLLAASVEGVEQGRGVVRGVLGLPVEFVVGERGLRCSIGADPFPPYDPGRGAYLPTRGPWSFYANRWYFTGSDEEALALGWALLDPAAPDGVRVPGDAA